VERISVGVASRPTINMESIQVRVLQKTNPPHFSYGPRVVLPTSAKRNHRFPRDSTYAASAFSSPYTSLRPLPHFLSHFRSNDTNPSSISLISYPTPHSTHSFLTNPSSLPQQAMEQFEQSGGNMSAMSMHEMLMNIAQFRAQAMGMTALGSGDEDADLREALARSVQESESKPSLPPPASLKAIGTLRSNKYSRVVCCPLLFVCPSTCPRPPPPNPPFCFSTLINCTSLRTKCLLHLITHKTINLPQNSCILTVLMCCSCMGKTRTASSALKHTSLGRT
jgi:hypothetical protein